MKAVLITVMILIVEIFAVALFTHKEWVEAQIHHEYTATVELMGGRNAGLIYREANEDFQRLVIRPGLHAESYRLFVPEGSRDMDGQRAIGDGITWFEQRLNAFWAAVFRGFQRWALFSTWLPYVLLLFLPAAIDGWTQRAIKKETYGYTSPVRYAAAFYMLVGLIVLPLGYFLVPVEITPLFPPVWAIFASASIVWLAANTQKHI